MTPRFFAVAMLLFSSIPGYAGTEVSGGMPIIIRPLNVTSLVMSAREIRAGETLNVTAQLEARAGIRIPTGLESCAAILQGEGNMSLWSDRCEFHAVGKRGFQVTFSRAFPTVFKTQDLHVTQILLNYQENGVSLNLDALVPSGSFHVAGQNDLQPIRFRGFSYWTMDGHQLTSIASGQRFIVAAFLGTTAPLLDDDTLRRHYFYFRAKDFRFLDPEGHPGTVSSPIIPARILKFDLRHVQGGELVRYVVQAPETKVRLSDGYELNSYVLYYTNSAGQMTSGAVENGPRFGE